MSQLREKFETAVAYLIVGYNLFHKKFLCKHGFHRYRWKTETLAFGEKLHAPVCTIFGCNHVNSKAAKLDTPKDGCNGYAFDLNAKGQFVYAGRVFNADIERQVAADNLRIRSNHGHSLESP